MSPASVPSVCSSRECSSPQAIAKKGASQGPLKYDLLLPLLYKGTGTRCRCPKDKRGDNLLLLGLLLLLLLLLLLVLLSAEGTLLLLLLLLRLQPSYNEISGAVL